MMILGIGPWFTLFKTMALNEVRVHHANFKIGQVWHTPCHFPMGISGHYKSKGPTQRPITMEE